MAKRGETGNKESNFGRGEGSMERWKRDQRNERVQRDRGREREGRVSGELGDWEEKMSERGGRSVTLKHTSRERQGIH